MVRRNGRSLIRANMFSLIAGAAHQNNAQYRREQAERSSKHKIVCRRWSIFSGPTTPSSDRLGELPRDEIAHQRRDPDRRQTVTSE